MSEERIHRATSGDGTRIAGQVHGEGPPLVLVHGAVDDEGAWARLLPYLTDRFTCYPMSTRGRGSSDAASDYAAERNVEDVVAFAESIGEPVGMIGLSNGGAFAIAAAARSDAVSAVVAHEPALVALAGQDLKGRFQTGFAAMAEAVEEGRSTDAARMFIEILANEEELAFLSHPDYLETWKRWARTVPAFLQQIQHDSQSIAPDPTSDPKVLAEVTAPVLLVRGPRSKQAGWFGDGISHVAEHVPDTRIREIEGAGHLAPYVHAEAFAAEIVPFLEPALQAA